MARTVAEAFDPPGQDLGGLGYTVECDATPPRFGMVAAGQTFWMDPRDMVIGKHLNAGRCASSVAPNNEANFPLSIIGAPLLRSLVATFDMEGGEMGFKQRARY